MFDMNVGKEDEIKSDQCTSSKNVPIFRPFEEDYMTDDLISFTFNYLDWKSHFYLEKVDNRFCALGRLPQSNHYHFNDTLFYGLPKLFKLENSNSDRISQSRNLVFGNKRMPDEESSKSVLQKFMKKVMQLQHLQTISMKNDRYIYESLNDVKQLCDFFIPKPSDKKQSIIHHFENLYFLNLNDFAIYYKIISCKTRTELLLQSYVQNILSDADRICAAYSSLIGIAFANVSILPQRNCFLLKLVSALLNLRGDKVRSLHLDVDSLRSIKWDFLNRVPTLPHSIPFNVSELCLRIKDALLLRTFLSTVVQFRKKRPNGLQLFTKLSKVRLLTLLSYIFSKKCKMLLKCVKLWLKFTF